MDDELGAALRDHFGRAADDIQPDAALLRRLRETASPSRDRAPSPRRALSLLRHPTATAPSPHPSGRGVRRRAWWAGAGVAAAVVLIALVFVLRPGVEEKTRPANRVVPPASTPTQPGPVPKPIPPGKPTSTPKPSLHPTPGAPTGADGPPSARPTRTPSMRPPTAQPGGRPSTGSSAPDIPHGMTPSSHPRPTP
ncbi:hypothetical protein [Actinomadura oligospora]|uniref:hypothetical protein n=1 Tax=Actinomadura oligospora TaxID=111804 RepID=UPI00047A074E|nr:hypothetical protein [Actinomadura oligospora]